MKFANSPVHPQRLHKRARVLALAITLASGAPAIFAATPVINVVDPSPVNWLSITWNTMEELVRVD